jgi:hypothetical protein
VTVNNTVTPPADTTNPTVSITAPANAATVSGSAVSITATASDNVGVSKVEFRHGTTLLGEDTTAPYSHSWDSTAVANGSYSLTARAYDAAGNTATSSTVTVTVNNTNPPVAVKLVDLSKTTSSNPGVVSKAIVETVGSTCQSITSATSLSATGLAAPKDITLDGGIQFSLSCTSSGQTATMKITLGQRYEDTTKLHAYKIGAGGELVDISGQVNFANTANATALTYAVVDGGQFDDDGVANGVIDDPVYIGYVAGASAAGPAGTLADTGNSIYTIALIAAALLAGAVGLQRNNHKIYRHVSFKQ